jgi:hypothetical protein
MANKRNSSDDDSLDALLKTAHWPEPSPESLDRLRSDWRRRLRRRRLIRASFLLGSAAAAVIAATALLTPAMREDRPKEIVQSPRLQTKGSDLPAGSKPAAPISTTPSLVEAPKPSINDGRRLNAAEEVFWLARANRKPPSNHKAVNKPAAQTPTTSPTAEGIVADKQQPHRQGVGSQNQVQVDEPLARSRQWRELLKRGRPQDARALVNAVLDRASSKEALEAIAGVENVDVEHFFVLLFDPIVETRQAAGRVLAAIDGPVVATRLAELAMLDPPSTDAMEALLQCPDPLARRFISEALADSRLAARVNAALAQTQAQ